MKTIKLRAMNESEMKFYETSLKKLGYIKTNDCMWAKIYHKDNVDYIISREY